MLSFLKNKYTLAYAMLQPFSTAFDVGAAYVLMVAIDFAASGSLEKWSLYLTGFLSYIILRFCTDLLTKRVQEKALATALRSLRKQLMAKILGMSTQTYSQKNSGAYLAYITKNTEKIDSLFFVSSLIFIRSYCSSPLPYAYCLHWIGGLRSLCWSQVLFSYWCRNVWLPLPELRKKLP